MFPLHAFYFPCGFDVSGAGKRLDVNCQDSHRVENAADHAFRTAKHLEEAQLQESQSLGSALTYFHKVVTPWIAFVLLALCPGEL